MPLSARARRVRMDRAQERLAEAVYVAVGELQVEAWVTPEPAPYAERQAGTYKLLKPGEPWGALWDCAWFRFTTIVPTDALGKNLVLLIDLNGEGCVVDARGNPLLGLTTVSSEFDLTLGKPGKRVVPLPPAASGGEGIEVWVEAGCNDLFGRLPNRGVVQEARLAIRREEVLALSYDFEVLRELLDHLPPARARHAQVQQALYETALILDREISDEAVAQARARLAPELARRGGDAALTVSAVGHAHIDLAWLWPLRETIRKGAHTFSTALRLMERYPDYVFGASQPQLYAWMKERYPALYAQIKARIAEGRWEVQGAMWVESDVNVPGGEALVRQLLYGKRFFRAEFGIDVTHLWMPDVFGYPAGLPQLLRLAGVDTFLTQKLSWNEYNTYPHNTFHWEGIDGSRVLVHMPPENTYNSSAAPRAVARAEEYYRDKAVSDRCLMLFGIGDGGGGPGEEHLERLAREKDLQGLPPVVQEPAATFFAQLAERSDRYATWRGELYLEKHQGTLTTQARSKRFNRRIEIALRELELSAMQALRLAGQPYPSAALDRIWKEILLLQFHDILPGSSIPRVYEESLARYAALTEEIAQLTFAADQAWIGSAEEGFATEDTEGYAGEARGGAVAVCNSLSWKRREWMQIDGRWCQVSVPGLGAVRVVVDADLSSSSTPFALLSATPQLLENGLLRVEFDASGDLISIFDKEQGREALRPGEIGNALCLFDDPGDAWDFPEDYEFLPPQSCPLLAGEARVEGPHALLRQTRRVGNSTLTQTIRLTEGSRCLQFETRVDWRENGKMLRVRFPVAVHAETARCEIQFGHIARPITQNTSWDMAKSEVCAHRWVDLSETGYGVAMLNDCKYGHRVQGGVLDLNLLRSPSHPDPTADRAAHTFTYALLPHAGDFAQGGVVRAAYGLNIPLRQMPLRSANARIPASLLSVEADNVIVEAIKKAEESDATIVRLYEAHGASTRTKVQFGFPVRSVALVNLMEEQEVELELIENGVRLEIKPFEILTLKVKTWRPGTESTRQDKAGVLRTRCLRGYERMRAYHCFRDCGRDLPKSCVRSREGRDA